MPIYRYICTPDMYLSIISRLALAVCIISLLSGCGEKVPLPHGQTTYDVSYSGDQLIGEPIKFQSSAPLSSTFEWHFGDGVVSYEPTPTHIYTTIASNGASIVADTVVLIIDNDVYHPNQMLLLLNPCVQKVKGTHVWKGGYFAIHGNCCPGLTSTPINDTTFGITVVDSITLKTFGVKLPYLADSNYYSNERSVGRYNSIRLVYTHDTLFFRQWAGTDTGWAETTYYHKY